MTVNNAAPITQALNTDPNPQGGTLIQAGYVSAGTTRFILPTAGTVQIEVNLMYFYSVGENYVQAHYAGTLNLYPITTTCTFPVGLETGTVPVTPGQMFQSVTPAVPAPK